MWNLVDFVTRQIDAPYLNLSVHPGWAAYDYLPSYMDNVIRPRKAKDRTYPKPEKCHHYPLTSVAVSMANHQQMAKQIVGYWKNRAKYSFLAASHRASPLYAFLCYLMQPCFSGSYVIAHNLGLFIMPT